MKKVSKTLYVIGIVLELAFLVLGLCLFFYGHSHPRTNHENLFDINEMIMFIGIFIAIYSACFSALQIAAFIFACRSFEFSRPHSIGVVAGTISFNPFVLAGAFIGLVRSE